MLLCLTSLLLLAAADGTGLGMEAEETGPGLGTAGVSFGAGLSRSVGVSEPPVRFFSSSVFLGAPVSPLLDLELSYDFLKREGRGPSHVGGVTGRLYPAPPVELELALLVSPLGRSTEGTYCTSEESCVDAVERVGFLNPSLSVGYTTDPDADLVGLLEASVEATFYRLDYRSVSGTTERPLFAISLQEYRLGLEAGVRLFDRIELGAQGSYGFLSGMGQPGAVGAPQLPPTELPLAPTRLEVGPSLALRLSPLLTARASAEYASYISPCFGHSLFGALRLTAEPGPLSIFGQVDLRRDVSPTDAATLQRCDQEEPFPDYVSTSVGAGVSVSF